MTRGYGGRGREWHPEFVGYMELIVDHPNYAGLPCARDAEGKIDWTIPSNRKPGSKNWDGNQQRREWWRAKAASIGVDQNGPWISATARAIHPLGKKPCQTCGRWMSISYTYPTKLTTAKLRKLTPSLTLPNWEAHSSVYDLADLLEIELGQDHAIGVLTTCFPRLGANHESLEAVLGELARLYIQTNSRLLSPGAMSNAPDRLDGFHTYNLCCRGRQDTGRTRENLNRYVVDRRAYEQWAEGDWEIADVLMKSVGRGVCGNTANCPSHGKKVQLTADHVGPISLGFRHSPYFEPLCVPCNSAKNNRMSLADVKRLIRLEETQPVISWHAKYLWEECSRRVESERGALLLSRLLRINQDAYIRFLAEGAVSSQPQSLLQFLGVAWAKWRVSLPDLDRERLTFTTVERQERQPKYATSRAARIIRIAYEALFDYAEEGKRNIHRVEWSAISALHADYMKALATTPANPPMHLVTLGSSIAGDDGSQSILESLLFDRISRIQPEAKQEYQGVGETLKALMLQHQRELVVRFEKGDHRGPID